MTFGSSRGAPRTGAPRTDGTFSSARRTGGRFHDEWRRLQPDDALRQYPDHQGSGSARFRHRHPPGGRHASRDRARPAGRRKAARAGPASPGRRAAPPPQEVQRRDAVVFGLIAGGGGGVVSAARSSLLRADDSHQVVADCPERERMAGTTGLEPEQGHIGGCGRVLSGCVFSARPAR